MKWHILRIRISLPGPRVGPQGSPEVEQPGEVAGQDAGFFEFHGGLVR
jgi:hypothetical protein